MDENKCCLQSYIWWRSEISVRHTTCCFSCHADVLQQFSCVEINILHISVIHTCPIIFFPSSFRMSTCMHYNEFCNYNLTWMEENVVNMFTLDYLRLTWATDEEIKSAVPSSPPMHFSMSFIVTYVSEKLRHIIHTLCTSVPERKFYVHVKYLGCRGKYLSGVEYWMLKSAWQNLIEIKALDFGFTMTFTPYLIVTTCAESFLFGKNVLPLNKSHIVIAVTQRSTTPE